MLVLAAGASITVPAEAQNIGTPQEIKSVMKRVADWQIANPMRDGEHGDLAWTQAALYVGMLDWAELALQTDNDKTYYNWLLKIGRRNNFQPGSRMYHADDIAVS